MNKIKEAFPLVIELRIFVTFMWYVEKLKEKI